MVFDVVYGSEREFMVGIILTIAMMLGDMARRVYSKDRVRTAGKI